MPIYYKGERIQSAQSAALFRLGPEWELRQATLGVWLVVKSLARRGFVELGVQMLVRGDRVFAIRLTPLGMACRDELLVRRAQRLRRKLGL